MSSPIRCLIIDDEPLAIQVLSNYVSKTPKLELDTACGSALEALEVLKAKKIDLIFLDIQMPDLTGLEMLDLLPYKPLIVFTTAFPDYALEGFNQNAVDYLLKPIALGRFLQAVDKVEERLNHKQAESIEQAVSSTQSEASPSEPQANHIFIKTEYKIVRVALDSILRIEGLKDYVKIYTDEAMLLSLMSIKELEKLLPSHLFARVHKSHIVGLNHINRIERNRIFIQEQPIAIGATYRQAFFEKIGV